MCLPALAKGSLEGVKIFIDPGHGGPDPGAVGLSGLYEADVNLRVSRVLFQLLDGIRRGAGHDVTHGKCRCKPW